MEKNSVTSRLKAIIIFPAAVLILLIGGVMTGITTAVVGTFFYIAIVFPLVMFSGLTEATDEQNLKVAKVVVDYALEQETGTLALWDTCFSKPRRESP